MKFKGELKFPEVDHPGVPVEFVLDDAQAELIVDGESLGRWSLYDIHARRLVASAFQIDLDGTEVTFVAQDPIDFAYRGVEHMAEAWASIKAKGIPTRSIAIRKSRRGTIPSRIEDLRTAMKSNLATAPQRRIAGEPSTARSEPEGVEALETPSPPGRDQARHVARPDVGFPVTDEAVEEPSFEQVSPTLSQEQLALEEEKRRIAEERARLDEDRRAAEQREANLLEAYRLEMQRLEAEREEVRRQTAEAIALITAAEAASQETRARVEPEAVPVVEPEPEVVVEPEPEPVVGPEPEVVVEPEPEPVVESEPEPVLDETRPVAVVDLGQYEVDGAARTGRRTSPVAPSPEPEPALAGASKDKRGIMGAVKAAFRSGPRDHTHQFVEAPGGIGITRYVCEECGYVSISVGD